MMFCNQQRENKELKLRANGILLSRIIEVPFKIDNSESFMLKTAGLETHEAKDKKNIQKALTLLQVHPCYLANILRNGQLTFED